MPVSRPVARSAATAVLILASCTATPPPDPAPPPHSAPPSVQLQWSPVALPDGAEPVTLTVVGSRLIVGADDTSGRVHPRLFSVPSGQAVREVRVTPRTPYGALARWQFVTADGARIVAVGGHPGGAHANTRRTTWTGDATAVTESPQTFDTFGGWGAGDVTGAVSTTTGTALIGSWQGVRTGLDGAVWLPKGQRWVRQSPPDPALQSTADRLVGLRSATGSGPSTVVVGSVLHLTQGDVRQAAVVWRSRSLNRGWTRTELADPGTRSEAISTGCDDLQQCLVAGYVDGRYALWSTTGSTSRRVSGLPDLPVDITDKLPVPITHGNRSVVVVPTEGTTTVLSGEGDSWTMANGPDGTSTSAALVGEDLLAIVQRENEPATLWRCRAQPLLT